MTSNDSTKLFIESLEGRKYKAYKDSVGKWTIGIGHLIKPNESNLLTKTLTDSEIDQLFYNDMKTVDSAISKNIKVKISQPAYDAIASFLFNVGSHVSPNITLFNKINSGASLDEIKAEFMKWVYATNEYTNQKVKVTGLENRRKKESSMYA